MDRKSNLRRTQSLKSVASSSRDTPVWTGAGLRDRKTSVSQLVARYQTTVEVSRPIDVSSTNCVEPKLKPVPQQETTLKSTTTTTSSSPNVSVQLESKPEHTLDHLLKRNEEKERSPVKTNLTRSKSMVSLQHSPGGTGGLRALFESKRDTPRPVMRAARLTAPPSTGDATPEAKGGFEGNEAPREKREGGPMSAGASIAMPDDAKVNAKEDGATLKVVNKTRTERRRTIAGIDFEKITASESGADKRRSIADFRDSSFIQASEISVKSISALYLSKVAAAEPGDSLLKPAQDHSSGFGKRVKMAEDPKHIKDDAPLPHRDGFQSGAGHVSGTHIQPTLCSMPPQQPSKETFNQQRQKCELRRLLKHTHPELMEEELAEVLSLESLPTAAETGYEGEVLSRRWLFENMCNTEAPNATKTHIEEGGDVRRTSAQNERINETLEVAQSDTSTNDHDVESEEMVRIDVQSARKIFESQRVDNFKPSSDSMLQGKVVISEDKTGAVQKRKQKSDKKGKKQKQHRENSSVSVENLDLAKQCHKQEPCIHVVGSGSKHTFYENQEHKKSIPAAKPVFEDQSVSFPNSFGGSFEETEGFEETVDLIRTSADLFQNNPFISTNLNRDKSHNCETKGQSIVSPHGDSPTVDNRASEAQVKNKTHLFESMPFHKIMHQNREEMEMVVERINETLNSLYHFNAIHSNGSVIEVHETMIATKAKYMLSQSGPEIQYDEVAEGGANNFILQLLPRANLKPQVIYLKEDKEGNVALTLVDVPVHQHQFNAKQDTEFKTANAVQLIEDILYQDNSLRKGVIIQEDEVTVYSLYRYAEGDVKSYRPPPQGCSTEPGEPAVSAVTNDSDIQDVRKGDVKSTISCLLANAQDQGCTVSIAPDANMRGNVKLFSSCIEKGDLEYLKTLQAEPSEQESCPDQNQALARDDTDTCPRQEDQQVDDPEWVPVDVKKLRNMFSADQRPVQPKPIIRSDAVHSTKLFPGLTCQSKTHGKGEPSSKCDTCVFSQDTNGAKASLHPHESMETSCTDADSSSDTCGAEGQQQGTEVVQKGHLKAAIKSLHTAATEPHQEDKEEVVHGNLRAAMDSLERSSINVSKGDFKAAMIYRGSSKCHKDTSKTVSTTVKNPAETESMSASCVDFGQLTTEEQSLAGTDTVSASDMCGEDQQGTEVVQKGHLKAAIKSLQSAATEELHQEDKEEVVHGNLQSALDSLERSSVNVSKGDFKAAMIYRGSSKSHKETNCKTVSVQRPSETESKSASCVDFSQLTTEEQSSAGTDTVSASDMCGEDQQGTEVVQKGHLKAAIKSLQSAATEELHQEEKEEVVHGNLQAALDSLERSSINVSKGDFKAAMIYRGSSKSHKESCKTVDAMSAQNPAEYKVGLLTESKSAPCETLGQLQQVVDDDEHELCHLKAAICSLQQATNEAKELSKLHNIASVARNDVEVANAAKVQAGFPPGDMKKQKTFNPTDHRSKSQHENTETSCTYTDSASETCSAEGQQQGTEVVQKGHLKAAIKSLQSAATEELHEEDKEEVVHGNLQSALDSLERSSVNVSKGDFKAAMIYRGSSKSHKETNCKTVSVQRPSETESKSASCVDFSQLTTEEQSSAGTDTVSASDMCGEDQQGTEVVQKGHLKAAIKSLQSAATEELHQEDKEEVVHGNLQSALDSLERSNINVSKGDFKAAMIYRGSSKSHKEMCNTVSVKNLAESRVELLAESKSVPCEDFGQLTNDEQSSVVAEPPISQTPHVPATRPSSKTSSRSTASKPVIPPKPTHLKSNHENSELTNRIQISATTAEIKESKEEQPPQSLPTKPMSYKDALAKGLQQTDCETKSSPHVLDCERCDANQPAVEATQMSEEIQLTPSKGISGASSLVHEGNISQTEGMPITSEEKSPQNEAKDDENAVEECPVDFQEARKKFGGGKNVQFKIAPVKPKRVRIAQNENKTPKHSSGHDDSTILTQKDAEPHVLTSPTTCSKPNIHEQTYTNNSTDKDNSIQTSKVVMRERKVRIETEDERLQRLSVHMDEIMRGNMTAAMEIFDNLRKQEELQNILTKVEEIEQDTTNVDVSSLRSVFENVPEWVVTTQAKKPKQAKAEHRVKTAPPQNTESMPSMAHVFGDLERASEEIMNLKEQTLARLVGIEDAIKKALCSVSNLKSDSDIAGLSGLFKASLGSSTSGNISQISIGSTRTATSQTQQSLTTQRVTAGLHVDQRPGSEPEVPGPKLRTSPPSSPAFIEIQSAARKNDKTQVVTPETATHPTCQHSPNTTEKFSSTKTLKCNAGSQGKKQDSRKGGRKHNKHNSKREVSVLEVQTDCEGNSVTGTKTENYERTDDFGNGVYSSKISTVVTTQPATRTSLSGQVVNSPTTNQVTTYPEVRLPINKKP